jgi:hypothetical protein
MPKVAFAGRVGDTIAMDPKNLAEQVAVCLRLAPAQSEHSPLMSDMNLPSSGAKLPYDVFLSYSRKDRAMADRLRRLIESFRPPHSIAGDRRPLKPWRDLEDIYGNELDQAIENGLAKSRKLLELCSPDSRRSPNVASEIEIFQRQRGAAHIELALVSGRPNEEVGVTDPLQDQAFPDILVKIFKRPLAADLRPRRDLGFLADRRHRREADLQLLAGLWDLPKNLVIERTLRRSRQRLMAAGAVALLAVTAGLGLETRRRAERAIADAAAASLAAGEPRVALQLAVEASQLQRGGGPHPHPQVASAMRRAIFDAGGYRLSSLESSEPDRISAYTVASSGDTVYGAGIDDGFDRTKLELESGPKDDNSTGVQDWLSMWRWDLATGARTQFYRGKTEASGIRGIRAIVASQTAPPAVVVVPDDLAGLLYWGPEALRSQGPPLVTPSNRKVLPGGFYPPGRGTGATVFVSGSTHVLDGQELWTFGGPVPTVRRLFDGELKALSGDGRVVITCDTAGLNFQRFDIDTMALVGGVVRAIDGVAYERPLPCGDVLGASRPNGDDVAVLEVLSPDDHWLAVLLSSNQDSEYLLIRMQPDARTWRLPSKWRLHNPNLPKHFATAFSQDSRWLAVGEGLPPALWDLHAPAGPVDTLPALVGPAEYERLKGQSLRALASTADGSRLALWVGSRVIVIAVPARRAPQVLTSFEATFFSDDVSSLLMSADGRWLIAHRRGYNPWVVDLESHVPVESRLVAKVAEWTRINVNSVGLTADGRWLIAAGSKSRGLGHLEMRAFPLDDTQYERIARQILGAMTQ